MDESRDIHRENSLARFFDKRVVRTNAYGGNQSGDRVYRRAERIAAALYLVTNHLPLLEPLRASVRGSALDMLEKVLSLRDEMRSPHSRHVADCRTNIRKAISLVRILAVSGFLSMQNADIVIDALDELGIFLGTAQGSPLSESVSFSREDFTDIPGIRVKDIRDTHTIKDVGVKDNTDVHQTTAHIRLTVRERSILQVLEGKGALGIRDITSNLPEYSEKMIQRGLATLVTIGKVRRTGLKRWSRYSLAI